MANEARRDDGRRGREGGRRDDRRGRRARQREEHTERMAQRYAAEIERAAEATREVEGMPKISVPAIERASDAVGGPVPDGAGRELPVSDTPDAAAVSVPAVHVLAVDAVTAILENGRGRAQFCDMTVIDFASFTNPGSGFDKGYVGQEQALCDASFLFNVLDRKRAWYAQNRRRNINCELYRDRALIVPAVCFVRDRVHAYADVIVTAAPNVRRARSEYGISHETLADAMRARIRFALAVADSLGHEKVVLGALGCDMSGWEAGEAAEMLRAELASGAYAVREVFVAVPRERGNENAARFEHAFACFPEKNGESFEDAQAARVARAQAVQEEDDGEDDWRKYL